MIENLGVLDAQVPSVLEQTVEGVGDSFQKMMDSIDQINDPTRQMNFSDVFEIQQAAFEYGFYQEAVSKIISKGATAINEVMKAQ